MSYTHFRMIAWELPTVVEDTTRGPNERGRQVAGWDAGNECDPVDRLPIVNAQYLSNDARIRLRRLASVVDHAQKELARKGDSDNTLKIFMVPEFYFRPPLVDATYRHNTYPDMQGMDIARALKSMFKHNDFKHWFFLCGTVMENQEIWHQRSNSMRTVYYNTAHWIWGGDRPMNRSWGWVEKDEPSDADGVPRPESPKMLLRNVHQDWKTRRMRVFQIDGVWFGLEICMDHQDHNAHRVLKQLVKEMARKEGAPDIKLHLLIAGGMPVDPGSVAAQVGGYFLRLDGARSVKQSELLQVQSYRQVTSFGKVIKQDIFVPGETSEADLSPVNPEFISLLNGAQVQPSPPGQMLTFGPQRLVFYPALQVPSLGQMEGIKE